MFKEVKEDWRLHWEGSPTVPVQMDGRPTLQVEENRQKDGSIVPGRHYFKLLTAEMSFHLPLWEGRLDVSLVLFDEQGWEKERWVLKGARNVNNGRQVAIAFDGLVRA